MCGWRRRTLEAAVVLLTLAATDRFRACGPFFPNRLLVDGEATVLSAFRADFIHEVERLLPAPPPPADAPAPGKTPTSQADQADLALALEASGVSPERRAEIIARHKALRDALTRIAPDRDSWKRRADSSKVAAAAPRYSKSPAAAGQALEVPEGLPPEFEDYLQGAVLYHRGNFEEARTRWEALLARPPAERVHRSTWAAFMLGKSWLEEDPAAAAGWFRKVRELAGESCADSLGLAAASLGWEAMADLERKDFVSATDLYLRQAASGERSAYPSLRFLAFRLLGEDGEALRIAAGDPATRAVITAYLLSGQSPRVGDLGWPLTEKVDAWLKAVEQAAVPSLPGADRIAWACYQRGDYEGARRWLERSSTDSAVALWIWTKLHLRAGHREEAMAILLRVVREFPEDERWLSPSLEEQLPESSRPATEALGELGVLQLSRRQYAESLDALLRSGYWLDAAYVAERVLTIEELLAYVDRNWPENGPGDAASTVVFSSEPKDLRPIPIRYLLARRLARHSRWKEARRFLPGEILRSQLDEYTRALREGRDRKRAAVVRGEALWRAAQIAREQGMDLLGTEVEPDWRALSGWYVMDPLTGVRAREPFEGKLAAASPDERSRAALHHVEPEKRFHYRYLAADLAWQAAALLPDGGERTAEVLWRAGSWLKDRDPNAADRFYKALVKRCGATALGREAERLKWFPREHP